MSTPTLTPVSRTAALRSRAGLLLLVALTACAPVVGPVDVEAVTLVDGVAQSETVTLQTPTDLYAGKGELFDVIGGLIVTLDFVLFTASDPANIDYTVEEMQDAIRPGTGANLTPRISYDVFSDRYVGDDFDSLLYLTLFYHLENVWSFYRDALGDTSAATDSRGLIGIYGGIAPSSFFPIPFIPPTDNAFYSPFGDAIIVLKVGEQEGIPLAMNPGLVAHEFSHRIFFHNVSAGPAFDAWKSQLVTQTESAEGDPLNSTAQNPNTRSAILYRGVDEGIADFFAATFRRSPRPIGASLLDRTGEGGPLSAERDFRDLEGEFAERNTYQQLLDGDAIAKECGRIPGEDEQLNAIEAQSAFNPYCLGVLLAKTLWETGGGDPDRLQSRIAPAVLRSLGGLSRRIADLSVDENDDGVVDALVFDTPMLLDEIGFALDGVDKDAFCNQLLLRFPSQLSQGLVPTCSAFTP